MVSFGQSPNLAIDVMLGKSLSEATNIPDYVKQTRASMQMAILEVCHKTERLIGSKNKF